MENSSRACQSMSTSASAFLSRTHTEMHGDRARCVLAVSIVSILHVVLGYSSCSDVTSSGLYTFDLENVYTKLVDKVTTYCQMDIYQGNWTLVGRTWPIGTGSHNFPFGWNESFRADWWQEDNSYSMGITKYLSSNWTTAEV